MNWKVFFLSLVLLVGTGCSGFVEDYLNIAREEEEDNTPNTPPSLQVDSPYHNQVSAGRARSVGTASSIEMRAIQSNQEMVGTSSSMKLSISK